MYQLAKSAMAKSKVWEQDLVVPARTIAKLGCIDASDDSSDENTMGKI